MSTPDFSMAEGRAALEVNGIQAFITDQLHTAVVVPTFEPGFHQIRAFLIDTEGHRIGVQSERVQFLYDPHHVQER
jgi:hypothetical protein